MGGGGGGGGGVVAHRDNVRPVGVAVNKDEVILSCIGAEVSGYFQHR